MSALQLQVDVLDPRATVECEGIPTHMTGSGMTRMSSIVTLSGKLYVGLHGVIPGDGSLYEFCADLASWSAVHVQHVPCVYYDLATYCSQLVLVGGIVLLEGVTNQLWVRVDDNWQPSLPPMPTKRFGATAVNTGTPDYLIVVGGQGIIDQPLNVVEVLVEGQWSTIECLPFQCHDMRHTIHNGNLYLSGWYNYGILCNLQSLVTRCKQAVAGATASDCLWSSFEIDVKGNSKSPDSTGCVVSLGKQLVFILSNHATIYAYSTLTQSLVNVGAMDQREGPVATVVLPTGEVAGISRRSWFKVSIKGLYLYSIQVQ